MKVTIKNRKIIGEKGDVGRYILYAIVILILLVVIIALFFGGARRLVEALFIKEVLK